LPSIKPAITAPIITLTPQDAEQLNWIKLVSPVGPRSFALFLSLSLSLLHEMLISPYRSDLVNCQLLLSTEYWRRNQWIEAVDRWNMMSVGKLLAACLLTWAGGLTPPQSTHAQKPAFSANLFTPTC